jgi:two-component system response regulator FixJ
MVDGPFDDPGQQPPPRRAYVVDDDAALRRTIARMLAGAGIETEEFDSAEAFLTGYSARQAGCVLLDVRLPGMDGLELLERIAALPPPNPVVMVSGFGDIPSAVRAVRMGAVDFIQNPFRKEAMLEVVCRALEKIEAATLQEREFEALTPRERDVLIAFGDGAANKIVAARLGLSPRTVEMHRARIFRKLGVANLPQALLRARDAGIIH